MDLIHFILDIAALLLWLNWRGKSYDALANATPATLAGTLRRAGQEPVRRWYFLVALLVFLPARAWLYQGLGGALDWNPQLNFIATRIAFKSDVYHFYDRMLIFSILSFVMTVAIFFLWLLLISILGRGLGDTQLPMRLARAHLGTVDRWPGLLKLLLPFVATASGWWGLSWALSYWGLMPHPANAGTRFAQAALVGSGSYLSWKYPIVILLGLRLLHNHVYLGNNPIWTLVDSAAKRLLTPFRLLPLVLARIDFAPILGIALVWFLAQALESGVRPATKMDALGRPLPPSYEIPGLADYYRRLSR